MKKILIVTAAVLLAACSSKDVYDPQSIEDYAKASYAESFKKAYPNVNLNQNWDYANKNEILSLPASGTAGARATTRAASYNFTTTDEYEVEAATLNWMNNQLKEGQNNRSKGKPFYMSVPNNSFTIVPISQGDASSVWELHLVVDGVDIKVWEKSQDMWVKKTASSEWIPVYDVSNQEVKRSTKGVAAVKAKGYTFSDLPVGKDMYFYLTVTKVNNSRYQKNIGAQHSSLNNMILALEGCPRPSNIPEDYKVMIVGCEDSDPTLSYSDQDMNDLVFMIYAKPEVPKPIVIEEGTPITKRSTVRYMIEDLGSTDDFDFNDIVVDVSDVCTTTPVYVNGALARWEDSNPRQEAIIRHLGGTLPFKLKIGNTELEEHQGVLGADPDEVYDVTGWDKNTHNISVQVRQKGNVDGVYNNVKFPKAGETPMIIAVEPTQAWMQERQSVPEEWFYVPAETSEE